MTEQWPLNGADAVCSLCKGRGAVSTDDGGASCPKCHGREECGFCGRLVNAVSIEKLVDSRNLTTLRCFDCRDRQSAAYQQAVA